MRLALVLSGVLVIATTAQLVSGCRPTVVVVRPVAVTPAAEPLRAVDLAFGDSAFCALREDGQVWCWGKGDHGGLGDGVRPAHLHAADLAEDLEVAPRGEALEPPKMSLAPGPTGSGRWFRYSQVRLRTGQHRCGFLRT